jgi:hypothetical protein
VIHEVDEGLRLLLAAEGLPGADTDLAFEAPTKEWAAQRTAPTVNVFLHDLCEDQTRRHTGTREERAEDGTLLGRREPPRWYQLSYLVTAWTARPTDEHRLLADALRALSRHELIDREWLTGSLAELAMDVLVEAAAPVVGGPAAVELWSALGGRLKPSISLRVLAPLAAEREPVGPAVTEGVVVRPIPPDGPGRRLRYLGPTTAEGDGLGPWRPKPEPGPQHHHGGRR